MENCAKHIRIGSVILLVFWLCFFLFQQIDLTTADLGRFVQNGQQIFEGNWQGVLKTNLYSYTNPQYPFLNHHWGTGVVFGFIHWLGGFLLLHLFSILLIIGTFLILFEMTRKEIGFSIAVLLSILLIPLMAYRKEIRPEMLSCFFSASFFSILWAHRNKTLSAKWLWVLPVLEVAWVNLHIYFFLGPAIVGAFLLEKVIFYLKDCKEKLRVIFYTFGSVLLATLINPFGWNNVIYPFLIYNNRGYRVLEEQSVWFIEKLGINNPSFLFFKITLAVLLISFVWIVIRKRKKFPLVNFFLISGFAFMACWSIRNITLFAFMSLPILAKNINIIWPNLNFNSLNKKVSLAGISLVLVFIVLTVYGKALPVNSGSFGLGVIKGQDKAIDFFKGNNLQGPIFNNYDIGGYLIYNLFPQEKVFVDNRPETYPGEFFQEDYIPMQEDDDIWLAKSKEYGINAIIFYRHDATPWGQQFLITRIDDASWAPVFVDDRVIIFLKRNLLNNNVIQKYEIPRKMFSIF